jgi:sucrose-6-phosphate hydrolase SacC (GH32 family)
MQQRPQIHFTPKKNWINDPNGLLWHDGEYHLYFQHNPHGNLWGNMSWGHAVSTDLITWEELPVAIEGNSEVGIFSGSAVFDSENTSGFGQAIVAIYTSATKDVQAQHIAYSLDKGRTFTRYEGNPVLDENLLEFRDPKVFKFNNEWRMVVVKAKEHKAAIYSSANLKVWKHESDFHYADSYEAVWECPDLFSLEVDGETFWVMLISVNPVAHKGGSGTKYFVGDFDGKVFTSLQDPQWLDWGRENYAGVTYNDEPRGKRIFIGWMNHWLKDNREMAVDTPWNGAMTIPRELSLVKKDGLFKLAQTPIVETEVVAADDPYIFYDAFSHLIRVGDYTAPYVGDPKLRVLRDHGSVEVFSEDGTISITMSGKDVI